MDLKGLEIDKLIALVSQDNQRAFDTFYHLYYEQVSHIAYYYVKDIEACREIVSTVFYSVWKSRKTLAEIRNLSSYLYTVTKNASFRYLSQNAGEQHISLSDLPIPLEVRDDSSPEADIISSELESTLARIVNSLPEKCRIIFLMSREQGIDNKEIANRLEISESTVRVQMKIAIDKIIGQLKALFPHLTFSFVLLLLLR